MRALSTLLRLVVALAGVAVGMTLFSGAASADELAPAAPACAPEAHVIAPLGPDGALPTARLVASPEAGAPAVPGSWAPTVVDVGAPTTATWTVPAVSTDPVTIFVVDGDRPAVALTLTPGCTDAGTGAALAVDCATGAATVTVTSWDQEQVAADITGDVTAALSVAPGTEATASAPAAEDTTVVTGVTVGRVARLLTAAVDCTPPPAPAVPTAPAAVEGDEVFTSPEHPKAAGTIDVPAVAALTVSAPTGTEGTAPLVAITQEAPRQVEQAPAQVSPENARVGSGQVTTPEALATPAPSLAFTGTETVDLLRLGAALVALGLATERLSRSAHFARKGGSKAV